MTERGATLCLYCTSAGHLNNLIIQHTQNAQGVTQQQQRRRRTFGCVTVWQKAGTALESAVLGERNDGEVEAWRERNVSFSNYYLHREAVERTVRQASA